MLNKAQFRFIALFAVILAALEAMYYITVIDSGFYRDYLEFNAEITGWIVNLIGYESTVHAAVISGDGVSMMVVRGCDALQPAMLYVAAICSCPARLPGRALAAVAGLGVLFGLNQIRLVSLFIVQAHIPQAFETAHKSVWPVIFMVAVLLIWVVALGKILPKARTGEEV